MAKNNKASILFDYDPSKPDLDFRCGGSKFSDMEWDFNGYVDIPHLSGARLKVKFHAFAHKPRMLEVVKWYMHHEMVTGKFSTAKRNLDGIVRFIKFINEYAPEIESFSDITQELLTTYFNYLFEAKSETTGNPLGATAIKKAALSVKEILLKGSVKGWEVPANVRYVQGLYDDMIINNKALKADPKKAEQILTAKVSCKASLYFLQNRVV